MANKLVRGSLIILIGNVIFRIGGYIYRFLMAILLGPTAYGILGITLPFQGIFQTLSAGGLPPAIAKYVVETLVGGMITLIQNEKFNGIRTPDYFFKNLSMDEKNAIIKKDPSYGKIVCRCEQVTEGEILRAIRENPPAKDIDGVKRRTRSGMGRCQGGFCQPFVAELIAKERGMSLTNVTKSGKGAYLLTGVTK